MLLFTAAINVEEVLKMLYIGSHVSFDKKDQLVRSVKEAISYGANTFMFYTGAPQNTMRYPIEEEKTKEALSLMKENKIFFDHVVVHAPYIINLANRQNMDFGVRFLTEELRRCDALGVSSLVLHPGSHVGVGVEEGIQNIIDGLNQVFEVYDGPVKILLETMAGKGSEIGRTLDEIKQILDGVKNSDRLGVCIDTCHLNDAGYDLSDFDSFLKEFDRFIGISRIGCVHINDSKNERGMHKDRHENLGYGTIGFESLLAIIYHPLLENIPKILETPYINREFPPYKEEIAMIRKKKFEPNWIETKYGEKTK